MLLSQAAGYTAAQAGVLVIIMTLWHCGAAGQDSAGCKLRGCQKLSDQGLLSRHTHTHTHTLTNAHTHTHAHARTHTHTHTHTHARTHARTHTHTHTSDGAI